MKNTITKDLPGVDEAEIQRLLEAAAAADPRKIIVLDDDPTGVQTVHGVSVYTDWSCESIRQGFEEQQKLFYILTNSRSFTEEETAAAHREIGKRALQVSRELGKDFIIVSRGDSTLRGHYPLETETLRRCWNRKGEGRLTGRFFVPFLRREAGIPLRMSTMSKWENVWFPQERRSLQKIRPLGIIRPT